MNAFMSDTVYAETSDPKFMRIKPPEMVRNFLKNNGIEMHREVGFELNRLCISKLIVYLFAKQTWVEEFVNETPAVDPTFDAHGLRNDLGLTNKSTRNLLNSGLVGAANGTKLARHCTSPVVGSSASRSGSDEVDESKQCNLPAEDKTSILFIVSLCRDS